MNSLRNKVQLIGNLGKDPEIKIFDSGKKKASLSLATTESYSNTNGEKVEDTQWHNLVVWGKTADIAEKYLHKGSQIAVDGKLNYRNYEDKNGEKKTVTEIVVNDIVMLASRVNNFAKSNINIAAKGQSTPVGLAFLHLMANTILKLQKSFKYRWKCRN
ncbi:MAG: single-stranded DNA-binding protein [Cyclobacteriaceae bacterium]|nr:single-stranded DNA-binding protein [Cyclobacteriaceae bacterium]